MSFSFKKKQSPENDINQPILFGCLDLDNLLDFAIPKATIITIIEDTPSRNYMSFIRYFIGMGVHKKQKTLVFDKDPEKWKKLVPITCKTQFKIAAHTSGAPEKNKIAWRYDSMKIAQKKEAKPRADYIFFDLSKNINSSTPEYESLNFESVYKSYDIATTKLEDGSLFQLIMDSLQDSLSSSSDYSPKRIVLPSFCGPWYNSEDCNAKNIWKFMSGLKKIIRSSHSVVLLTIPPSFLDSVAESIIISQSDFVFGLSPVGIDSVFTEFDGILKFMKFCSLTKFQQYMLEHNTYGIKISKKVLEIELLYETPVFEDNQSEKKESLVLKQTNLEF